VVGRGLAARAAALPPSLPGMEPFPLGCGAQLGVLAGSRLVCAGPLPAGAASLPLSPGTELPVVLVFAAVRNRGRRWAPGLGDALIIFTEEPGARV